MKKKRILVIKLSSADELTSSNMRTLALIKGLLEIGFEVYWLTIPGINTTVKSDATDYSFYNDIKIITTNENKTYSAIREKERKGKNRLVSILRRVYHRLTIFDFTYSIAKRFDIRKLPESQFDYLITVSDPKTSHLLGRRLLRQGLRVYRWIQYWGDPLRGDITRKTVYPDALLSKVEDQLLKKADKIVYTSPFTLNEEKKCHEKYSKKMVMLPTPYIRERYFEKHKRSKIVLGYFGAYYSNVRNIMPLYDAISKLKNVELIIVGDSDIQLKETNNIKVYGRRGIEEFEAQIDAYVCILNSSGTQIPGKIYHNSGTNLPIIVLLDGDEIEETRFFLEGFGRFIVFKNNEEEILKAIEEVENDSKIWLPCKQMQARSVATAFISEIG